LVRKRELALIPARVKLFAGKGDLPVLVGEMWRSGARNFTGNFGEIRGWAIPPQMRAFGALRLG
jgi:hypothetical protein